MKRTILVFSRQISVFSGKAYGNVFAKSLAKLNYSSNYWATANFLKNLTVSIKEGELGKGIPCTKGCLLYNATQTNDPAKVVSVSGQSVPTFFIGGTRLWSKGERATVETGPNMWLTQDQIEYLELNLKENVKSILGLHEEGYVKCYALESIVESDELQKTIRSPHLNVNNGCPFSGKKLLPLLRDTMKKKFSSSKWVTAQYVKQQGYLIQQNQSPTIVFDRATELYNADQLVDPAVLAKKLENFEKYQVYGPSGKFFPPRLSDQLAAFARENPSYLRFWIHFHRAKKNNMMLCGEHATEITGTSGQKSLYVNAAQLKPTVIDQYIAIHEERRKCMTKYLDKSLYT